MIDSIWSPTFGGRRDAMADAAVANGYRSMSSLPFRAIALGIDGTLAHGADISARALQALRRARAEGRRIILVTGRTVGAIQETFPDVVDQVDAVVAENGAMLVAGGRHRALAPPLDPAMAAALADRGVEVRRGAVIGVTDAGDEHAVLDEVRRLELDYQLVRNRDRLLILPPGVSKGSGLLQALRYLGLSPRDTLAIGDAENDHSLFDVAEFGVAVADAVRSLRHRADLVLDEPGGAGIAHLLDDDLLDDPGRFRPKRRLVLGVDDRGEAVGFPASPRNLLVAGGRREQRMRLAGLVAERLTALGYSAVVVDAEGDFPIGRTPELVRVSEGRADHPSAARSLPRLGDGAVVDLPRLDRAFRAKHLERLLVEIHSERRARGLPHWVVVEDGAVAAATIRELLPEVGRCLIVGHPSELAEEVIADTDVGLIITDPEPDEALVRLAATISGLPCPTIATLLAGTAGRILLVSSAGDRRATSVSLASEEDARVDALR
jgi:hydroxymethylpyrimidine pyrophosphatase-like HAD family hydrolase